jgi:hypothetical protein
MCYPSWLHSNDPYPGPFCKTHDPAADVDLDAGKAINATEIALQRVATLRFSITILLPALGGFFFLSALAYCFFCRRRM